SFVMVDIPGLIEGAAEGAGLGIRFLKHLQRTRLMLHLVDLLPPDGADITANVRTINAELAAFSADLAAREQWLVFSKTDLMPRDEADALIARTLRQLKWKGRWFAISAVTGAGCPQLCEAAMTWIEQGGKSSEPAAVKKSPAPARAKAAAKTAAEKKMEKKSTKTVARRAAKKTPAKAKKRVTARRKSKL
ncbi:MAG TPA: GTPase, partial [Nevskiaceae bacterium]|nr:GTPase [Nevskiaceae bacterium]